MGCISRFALLFLLLCLIKPVEARWANSQDLDISTESYDRHIDIHKDGTYVETITLTLIATKESGKDKLVSFPLIYNAASSKLKVLEAKTILNGEEYPVDLKQIEDKPLASSPKGFDQNHQVLIAFPSVAVNAKIYLKYQTVVNTVPVPGFFSTDFIFGMDSYWQASQVQVTSALPFHVKVQDIEKVLEIKQKQVNNQYQMDIVLKKPVIKVPLDEQYMVFNSKFLPWVTISTLQEWPALGEKLTIQYEAILDQPLPTLLEKIAKEAETKSTLIEKINSVTAQLSENITYMGDWRTVKGACIPRPLAEIVKTKIGDCKDFSAVTVAILRRIGIKAHVALVSRGMIWFKSPNHDLPNLQNFNHAFVQVEDGTKTLWVDPTNFISFAQGIYPDIADRAALILKPTMPALLYTKNLTEEDSKITFLKTVFLPKEKSDITNMTCKITLNGLSALPLTGVDLKFSKETINRALLSAVTDEGRVIKWEINPYNLTSRVAGILHFNFNFTEQNTQMKTTAGNAFLLTTPRQVSRLLVKTDDRVTDLLLDEPGTYQYETLLSKKTLVGTKDLACQVESPWFKGSRMIKETKEGIQVLDELIVKKDRILNEALKTTKYTQFQNEIFSCFGDKALVYKH